MPASGELNRVICPSCAQAGAVAAASPSWWARTCRPSSGRTYLASAVSCGSSRRRPDLTVSQRHRGRFGLPNSSARASTATCVSAREAWISVPDSERQAVSLRGGQLQHALGMPEPEGVPSQSANGCSVPEPIATDRYGLRTIRVGVTGAAGLDAGGAGSPYPGGGGPSMG